MQAQEAFELVSQLIAHSPGSDNVSVDDLQRLQVRLEETSLPEVMALLEQCRDSGAVIEVELVSDDSYVLVQARDELSTQDVDLAVQQPATVRDVLLLLQEAANEIT